jgi:hypothetical protein
MEFITCPWCGQRNPADALECRKCGGPLPVPGIDPGPEPPLPPRTLPKGYKSRMYWKNSPMNTIGLIFAIIGVSIGCLFPVIGLVSGLLLFACIGGGMGLLFGGIGGAMLYSGVKTARGKLRPYEFGIAAPGEITDIYHDTTVEVNGRNPWAVQYIFEANGEAYEGKTVTWKYAPKLQKVGNYVWVLYMPDDPEQNVLYPPLG